MSFLPYVPPSDLYKLGLFQSYIQPMNLRVSSAVLLKHSEPLPVSHFLNAIIALKCGQLPAGFHMSAQHYCLCVYKPAQNKRQDYYMENFTVSQD